MASRGVGTRNRPTSPLQLGVTDPEQILRKTRKVRRLQSLPSLSDPEQLNESLASSVAKKEKETSPWVKPTIPDSSFQIFTNPQSFIKANAASPGKIPLFSVEIR